MSRVSFSQTFPRSAPQRRRRAGRCISTLCTVVQADTGAYLLKLQLLSKDSIGRGRLTGRPLDGYVGMKLEQHWPRVRLLLVRRPRRRRVCAISRSMGLLLEILNDSTVLWFRLLLILRRGKDGERRRKPARPGHSFLLHVGDLKVQIVEYFQEKEMMLVDSFPAHRRRRRLS